MTLERDGSTSAIISSISIDALLAARDAAHAAVDRARAEFAEAKRQLGFFSVDNLPELTVTIRGEHYRVTDDHWIGFIRKEFDRCVWRSVLKATNVDALMDSETRRELDKQLYGSRWSNAEDEVPELTKENLIAAWDSMVGRADEFFERCVDSVYRSLSWDHKTNTPGLIGERLIVRGLQYAWARAHQGDSTSLQHHEPSLDLERCLAVVARRPQPTHDSGLRALRSVPFGEWVDVPYPGGAPLMSVRAHRNGTTHVRVLDPAHVRELNAVMARRYPGQVGTGSRRARGATS